MLVVAAADAIQSVAELASEQPVVVGLPETVGERAEPLEPVQVGLQVFRGHAMEAEHEILQPRVQRVHPVDGVVVGVGLREVRAQFGQRLHVGGRAVGQHVRSASDMWFQRGHGSFLGDDAATAHGQERPASVVHAGRHAYLLLRQSALAQCLSALMCLAGHDEHGGLRVVALEALAEVRLVQLDGHACFGAKDGRVAADAFDDPLAHEERGLQAHAAPLGALAQA